MIALDDVAKKVRHENAHIALSHVAAARYCHIMYIYLTCSLRCQKKTDVAVNINKHFLRCSGIIAS